MIIHQPSAPKENDRRTPRHIVELARLVLDEIDLDPASDRQANEVIQAKRIYTKEENGLTQEWFGSVFLNPPGGFTDTVTLREPPDGTRPKTAVSSMSLWWYRLARCYQDKLVTQAVFVAFNTEALSNTQKLSALPIQAFPFCVPVKRLCYASADGTPGNSPQGCSIVAYLGPNVDRFREVFSVLGYCTKGDSR